LNVLDELLEYRKAAQAAEGSTAVADALVQDIVHLDELALLSPLLARLADESDRIGWFRDCDYAALALQAACSQGASPQLRKTMMVFALGRARWCASCATAGGEGLARSLHVHELEALARTTFNPSFQRTASPPAELAR